MSSDLNDAVWQLAEELATSDGFDWFAMGPLMKTGYLGHAQGILETEPERIEALAAKFRNNDEEE